MTQQNPDASAAVDDAHTSTRKPRRMARVSQQGPQAPQGKAGRTATARTPSKLDQVEALLRAPGGASIAELVAATGWQQHSVRGAMAGALRQRGLVITSDKSDGVRRYRVVAQ